MNKTTEALKLADVIISRYRNETPIGNQPHMICHIADEALAAIREALTEPVCQTCNGLGVIGGFVNMDSGYQDDPCPDCVEPVKQEPVAWRVHPFDYGVGHEGAYAMTMRLEQVEAWNRKGWIVESLYATPVDAKAIRAEALDKVVKFLSESGLITPTGRFAAAIRGLK